MKKHQAVTSIENGTVIDHITAGLAYDIVALLDLTANPNTVTVGMNLPSQRLTRKDIIKVEGRFFAEKELEEIGVFAPDATLNIIENYQIVSKQSVKAPEKLTRLLKCPNPNCITHEEPIQSFFTVDEIGTRILLRCHYCERLYERHEIKERNR